MAENGCGVSACVRRRCSSKNPPNFQLVWHQRSSSGYNMYRRCNNVEGARTPDVQDGGAE